MKYVAAGLLITVASMMSIMVNRHELDVGDWFTLGICAASFFCGGVSVGIQMCLRTVKKSMESEGQ
jgi:hypothetical protein